MQVLNWFELGWSVWFVKTKECISKEPNEPVDVSKLLVDYIFRRCVAAWRSGQLLLIDCAGTERRKDAMYHSKERQQEGAEINASLHALKDRFVGGRMFEV